MHTEDIYLFIYLPGPGILRQLSFTLSDLESLGTRVARFALFRFIRFRVVSALELVLEGVDPHHEIPHLLHCRCLRPGLQVLPVRTGSTLLGRGVLAEQNQMQVKVFALQLHAIGKLGEKKKNDDERKQNEK